MAFPSSLEGGVCWFQSFCGRVPLSHMRAVSSIHWPAGAQKAEMGEWRALKLSSSGAHLLVLLRIHSIVFLCVVWKNVTRYEWGPQDSYNCFMMSWTCYFSRSFATGECVGLKGLVFSIKASKIRHAKGFVLHQNFCPLVYFTCYETDWGGGGPFYLFSES